MASKNHSSDPQLFEALQDTKPEVSGNFSSIASEVGNTALRPPVPQHIKDLTARLHAKVDDTVRERPLSQRDQINRMQQERLNAEEQNRLLGS